jgi:hypothetical protein
MLQKTRSQLSEVSSAKWRRAAWTARYWEYYTGDMRSSAQHAPFFAKGKDDSYYADWGFENSQLRAR